MKSKLQSEKKIISISRSIKSCLRTKLVKRKKKLKLGQLNQILDQQKKLKFLKNPNYPKNFIENQNFPESYLVFKNQNILNNPVIF